MRKLRSHDLDFILNLPELIDFLPAFFPVSVAGSPGSRLAIERLPVGALDRQHYRQR
jgi:hypothetical protein